jgi:hypothetical protein
MNKRKKPKKIVFKYTVKLKDNERPKTFYVKAFTEQIARKALSEDLQVPSDKLRVNKNNLPYKVRQKLFDENNKEYQIYLEIDTKPEVQRKFQEIHNELFDTKSSQIKSLRYRIQALLKQDPAFIKDLHENSESINNWQDVYELIGNEIKKHNAEDELYDDNLTFKESWESYLYPPKFTNYEENKKALTKELVN